jgi:triacylglycerol esterase/lipase EstA (alpha/beta hydrolase family)
LVEFHPFRIEDLREKEKVQFSPIFFEECFLPEDVMHLHPHGGDMINVEDVSDSTTQDESCLMDEDYFPVSKPLAKVFGVNNTPRQEKVNLVVLCHGFQGSSLDMFNLRHYFSLRHPKNLYLASKANQDNSVIDINVMGAKLAHEVVDFINMYVTGGEESVQRLSFVGHSMGGLIIRAALPMLKNYSDRMGTYMSFSSPHLGVNKGDS